MSSSTNRQWSSFHKEKQHKVNGKKSLLLVMCFHVTRTLLYELWNPLILPKEAREGNMAKVCTRKRLQKNKGARADVSKRELWQCQWRYVLFYLKMWHSLHKSQRLELASPNSYSSLCTPKFWPATRSAHVYLRMDTLFSWTLLQVEWWFQRGRPSLPVTACS